MGIAKLEEYLIGSLNAGDLPSIQWRCRKRKLFRIKLVNRNNSKWSPDKLLEVGAIMITNNSMRCLYTYTVVHCKCLHELLLVKGSQLIVNGFISKEIDDMITFICSK